MFDYHTFFEGQPYYKCPQCAEDGYCMAYGHNCAILRCSEKPDSFQPLEDGEPGYG